MGEWRLPLHPKTCSDGTAGYIVCTSTDARSAWGASGSRVHKLQHMDSVRVRGGGPFHVGKRPGLGVFIMGASDEDRAHQ